MVFSCVTTDPKTGRKEIWEDGKLVQVLYPEDYIKEMAKLGIKVEAFTW